MTEIIKNHFGKSKAIIAMVHFPPLPGSYLYDALSPEEITEWVYHDLSILQEEGVDAVMFGNEADRPYQVQHVDVASPACMANTIGTLKSEIRVPFGVDVLWDPHSTIALAKATGASFAREIFTNVFGSDMGLWNTNPGEVFRYKRLLEANDLLLLHNIQAEFAAPLAPRDLEETARSAVVSSLSQVICVSGPITGEKPIIRDIERVKMSVGEEIAVFANTGVNLENIEQIIKIADGVVIGTSLKKEGCTWNQVDRERVKRFMGAVNDIRG